MVIGITGKKRSGKDTAGKYFSNLGFVQLQLAKPLKEWLIYSNPVLPFPIGFTNKLKYIYTGIKCQRIPRYNDLTNYFDKDAIKDTFPYVRQLLQKTGTDLVRTVDENFWANAVVNFIKDNGVNNNYFITDIRFDNEVEVLKQLNTEVIIIKITRDTCLELNDNHPSESGISAHLVNSVIDNNGTIEQLENTLDLFFHSVLKRKHK